MADLKILVVYPHPADSATEAAGTIALHAERGDSITSVIVHSRMSEKRGSS